MITSPRGNPGGRPELADEPAEEPPRTQGSSSHGAPAAVVELEVAAPQDWPLPEEKLREVIERAVAAALAEAAADGARVEREGVPPLIEVLLTDDEEIRRLNAQWREKDKPTNVLSFPAGETPFVPDVPWPLGTLALAGGVLRHEAQARGVPLEEHLSWLVVHGILHLLGYDHEQDEAEAEHMEALERRAMTRMGLADPYAEHAEARA